MDEKQRRQLVEDAQKLVPPGYVLWPGYDEEGTGGLAYGEDRASGGSEQLAGAGFPPGEPAGFPSMHRRTGLRILGTEVPDATTRGMSPSHPDDEGFGHGDVIRYYDAGDLPPGFRTSFPVSPPTPKDEGEETG